MMKYVNTTPIFIQVSWVFYYILSEIEQIYHGENVQPFSNQGLIVMNRWIHWC
jgi:hypothetical protein